MRDPVILIKKRFQLTPIIKSLENADIPPKGNLITLPVMTPGNASGFRPCLGSPHLRWSPALQPLLPLSLTPLSYRARILKNVLSLSYSV